MISIVVGLTFLALGLWGIARWFPDFIVVAKGFGSLSLLIGGTISLIMGLASFRKNKVDEKKE